MSKGTETRGVPGKRCSENMRQIYRRTPMPKGGLCKVAAYFQDTLSSEHLWRVDSEGTVNSC